MKLFANPPGRKETRGCDKSSRQRDSQGEKKILGFCRPTADRPRPTALQSSIFNLQSSIFNLQSSIFNLQSSFLLLLLLVLLPLTLFGQSQAPLLGDEADGNRSVPVHLLKLYDYDGSVVRLDDHPLMPFSTRTTCGECHTYETISKGWHFNANDSSVAAGRKGEPWIYVDRRTFTQLPMSRRDWPNTVKPEDIGLNTLEFGELFGRHLPGGGAEEDESMEEREDFFRWAISGKLEINCLGCHDAEAGYDQAEFATQTRKQNFRWAAAASSGFATVRGSAKSMPDNYDIYLGIAPDEPSKIPPGIEYDASRFNDRDQVFFDVVRQVPAQRCYYCHSTKEIDSRRPERWSYDEDIHMTSGMTCIDCHRNDQSHDMVRGYEGEGAATGKEMAESLTCAGCHIPDANAEMPLSGRLSAPEPEHAGIPAIHFEELSCTACHSGPWPDEQTMAMKTSRAHALGTHGVDKNDEAPPHIGGPVFARAEDGKITPHKIVWPAYWGRLAQNEVEPLPIEEVRPVVAAVLAEFQARADSIRADSIALADSLAARDSTAIAENTISDETANPDSLSDSTEVAEALVKIQYWPDLNDEKIATILERLSGEGMVAVYINGGRLYQRSGTRGLQSSEHPAAEPYTWPFAHDVRPTSQSLGVRGCDDCHNTDAPFYFGDVTVTPVLAGNEASHSQTDFMEESSVYAWLFGMLMWFRPWLKIMIWIAAILISAMLVLYAGRAFSEVLDRFAESKK